MEKRNIIAGQKIDPARFAQTQPLSPLRSDLTPQPPSLQGKGESRGRDMEMEKRNIIAGQKIDPGKLARAKELRQNMTAAEKCLWDALRGNKLDGFHFRRQQVIDGLIVDFYCHKAGLVMEVDGPVHEMQKEYDQLRADHLIGRGLVVLRFRNEEVMKDLGGVLENIRTICHERVETGANRT